MRCRGLNKETMRRLLCSTTSLQKEHMNFHRSSNCGCLLFVSTKSVAKLTVRSSLACSGLINAATWHIFCTVFKDFNEYSLI